VGAGRWADRAAVEFDHDDAMMRGRAAAPNSMAGVADASTTVALGLYLHCILGLARG